MIKDIKYTFRKTALYSLGNISIKLIGLILLPFYTSALTTAQYGILAILETTLNILSPLSFFNINNSIVRFYSDKNYSAQKGIVLFNALIFTLFSGLLLNLIFQPLSPWLSINIFNDIHTSIYFNILFLNIFLQGISFIIVSYYNAKELALKVSLFNLTRFSFVLILTILFLTKYNLGIKGVLLAQTIAFLIVIAIFIKSYIKEIIWKIDFYLLKQMLKYSAPLAFSMIASMIFSSGDRYVIKFLMGDASVGIYTLSVKLANVIDFILLYNTGLAYQPYAFSNYSKKNFKIFHARMTTYLVMAIIILSIGLSLFAKEAIIIFSPSNQDYWKAAVFVPFLAFLRPLYGTRFMLNIGLLIKKKTKIIPFIVITTAALNILLDFIFIPKLKIIGAILASAISLIILNAVYFYYSQRYFKVKYEYFRISILYISAIIITLIGLQIHGKIIFTILIKLLLILIYVFFLWFLNFFKAEEILAIKGLINKWKNPKDWKQNISNLKN